MVGATTDQQQAQLVDSTTLAAASSGVEIGVDPDVSVAYPLAGEELALFG